MARFFKISSLVCVGIALVCLAVAVLNPASYSSLMNIGLAFLVCAFGCSIWFHYSSHSPVPTHAGAVITIQDHPLAYRTWFVLVTLFCGFLLYVLLHSFL